MKFNYKVILAALSVAFIATLGCDDASKKADQANQTGLLALSTAAASGPKTICTGACHDDSTTLGAQVLAAKKGYEQSGHANGPRVLDIKTPGSAEYKQEGSNADYCNDYCHSHDSFVNYLTTGATTLPATTAGAAAPNAPIQCFTCHAPHTKGDFSLRTEAAVNALEGGTVTLYTYDGGAGNLCVNCHQARTWMNTNTSWEGSPTTGTSAWPKPVGSSSGTHHGPQGDILSGVNFYAYAGQTYTTATSHKSGLTDTCVSCHHYTYPGQRSDDTSAMGHAFYMETAVHGTVVSHIDACYQSTGCHGGSSTAAFTVTAPITTYVKGATEFWMDNDGDTVVGNSFSKSDIDGDGNSYNKLTETWGLAKKLIVYFGTGANFRNIPQDITDATAPVNLSDNPAAAGEGPIHIPAALGGGNVTAVTLANPAIGELWNVGWEFQNMVTTYTSTTQKIQAKRITMTQKQSRAFWNLKYYLEDRSHGIHNPTLMAQLLYDSIADLNTAPTSAGIVLGTRP